MQAAGYLGPNLGPVAQTTGPVGSSSGGEPSGGMPAGESGLKRSQIHTRYASVKIHATRNTIRISRELRLTFVRNLAPMLKN